MAAPASQAADAAPKKMTMKRTSFSPWTAAGLGSGGRATPQKPSQQAPRRNGEEVTNPSPARVMSDVLLSTESTPRLLTRQGVTGASVSLSAAKPSMAGLARIQRANTEWEQQQKQRNEAERSFRANSTSSEDSSSSDASSVPAILPNAPSGHSLPALHPSSSAPAGTMQRKRISEAISSGPKRLKVLAEIPLSSGSESESDLKGLGPELRQAFQQAKDATKKQFRLVDDAPSPRWTGPKTGGELVAQIRAEGKLAAEGGQSPEMSDASFTAPQARREPILTTADGRPYDVFRDEDGTEQYMKGALFPTGYKRSTDTLLPFDCPVGCGGFPKLNNLRGHMCAAHRRVAWHDNCDGTMKKVGEYKNAGSATSPAIIVSRAPSAEKPIGLKATSSASQAPAKKKTETPVPLPQQGLRTTAPTDIKSYLNGLLSPAQVTPDRPDVQYMLQLKKKRDLPPEWIQRFKGKKLENTIYAASLAYICGEQVTGDARCVSAQPNPTAVLSAICVTPPLLPSPAQEVFSNVTTCVGCKYYSAIHRQTNKCDWAETRDSQSRATSESADEVSTVPASSAPTRQKSRPSRSEGSSMSPAVQQPGPEKIDKVREAMSAAGRAAAQLEMEDWEFAPGRKVDLSTNETIAISSAYQTTTQPIAVSEDVGINDIVVERGRSHHWPAEKDKLRICYVAAGKVLVKMGGEEFQQGPNSSLVIRPGKTCTVENKLYVDAVVHCTTINDYEVQEA